MYVDEVTVQNQVGLHARPATFFIQKANEFKSTIWVEREERRVNAKSLLGVLSLGIVGGMSIKIIADGPDENSMTRRRSAGILGVFQALTTKSEPKKTSQIVQIIFEQCLSKDAKKKRMISGAVFCIAAALCRRRLLMWADKGLVEGTGSGIHRQEKQGILI